MARKSERRMIWETGLEIGLAEDAAELAAFAAAEEAAIAAELAAFEAEEAAAAAADAVAVEAEMAAEACYASHFGEA